MARRALESPYTEDLERAGSSPFACLRDTTLLPLSLVLKEMHMVLGTYEGSPAEPGDGSALLGPPSASDARERDQVTGNLRCGTAPDAARPTSANHRGEKASRAVDDTDWLKTAAIISAVLDHLGLFFMEDDQWWSVVGRLAAPTFFFLMGYAQTRAVPPRWIWIGVVLTLLTSWDAGWTWVAPDILLSLAVTRVARPHVELLVQRHGWIAFGLLVAALIAVLPVAGKIVEYGAEGWLWALFGLCQRTYVDRMSAVGVSRTELSSGSRALPITENPALMRLLACVVAAIIYVWQEQRGFAFPCFHLVVVIVGVGVLSTGLCLFRRGPSRIQPPEPLAQALRFVGRHTLEIYAIQLAGSELIVKLVPDLP